MVLHTWTRDLRYHPHVHALVAAGGLLALVGAVTAPDDTRAQVAGLIDMAALEALIATATTPKSRGVDPEVAGGLRGGSGPVVGRSRGSESPADAKPVRPSGDSLDASSKTHCSPPLRKSRSYPQPAAASLAAAAA